MTDPEALYELEERIAIAQEGSNEAIEVVRRDVRTGELSESKPSEVRR